MAMANNGYVGTQAEADQEFDNHMKVEYLLDYTNIILRQVFRKRWKWLIGTEWNEAPRGNAVRLIERYRGEYAKLGPEQRANIESGQVDNWDVTALTGVLSNVKFHISGVSGDPQMDDEHLSNLRKLRNIRMHDAKLHLCPQQQFDAHWPKAETALLYFGADQIRLNEIKNATRKELLSMSRTNRKIDAANTAKARALKADADDICKEDEYEDAIPFYTDALELSNISDEDIANLYTSRADAYLKLIKTRVPKNANVKNSDFLKTNAKLALADGKSAIECRLAWYGGYFYAGKAYMLLEKLEKAVHHFELAASLAPGLVHVEQARDDARLKRGSERRGGDQKAPAEDLEEGKKKILEMFRDRFGPRLNLEFIAHTLQNMEDKIPGQIDVNLGHDLREGLNGVAQDLQEAVSRYKSATAAGNAEGAYSLALMYQKGMGVDQDFNSCLTFLRKAAAMPNLRPNSKIPVRAVRGVAQAAHALGHMYADGVGVAKDHKMASVWYLKGSMAGFHAASASLGMLYASGNGVPQDLAKAVGFMRLAAIQGCPSAMRWLTEHYIDTYEPELARIWYAHALSNGYGKEMSEDDKEALEECIVHAEQRRVQLEEVVSAWESQAGLDSSQLTLFERQAQMGRSITPPSLQEAFDKLSLVEKGTQKKVRSSVRVAPSFDAADLMPLATRGSKTAQRVMKALCHVDKVASMQETGISMWAALLPEMAGTLREEPIVWQYSSEGHKNQIREGVMNFLRVLDEGGELVSDLDRDVRICVAHLTSEDPESNLRFIEASRRKYPNELFFHRLSAKLSRRRGGYDKALEFVTESLQKFPRDVELLYNYAATMQELPANKDRPGKAVQVWKAFIAAAPPDHPKLPRAYFQLAILTWHDEYLQFKSQKRKAPSEAQPQIKFSKTGLRYHRLGLDAEKKQLPQFLAFHQNQNLKANLGVWLQAVKQYTNPTILIGTGARAMDGNPERMTQILTNPHRAHTVKEYRRSMAQNVAKRDSHLARSTGAAPKKLTKLRQYAPSEGARAVSKLKSITLVEMDPCKPQLYPNEVLLVTCIEECYSYEGAIIVLVEDVHRDVAQLTIENRETRFKTRLKLEPGTKIRIMNPYYEPLGGGDFQIVVETRSSIVVELGPLPRVCRFCGCGGTPKKECGNCGYAWYCDGSECMELDRRSLGHEYVCRIYLNFRN